jgi:transposase
MPEISPETTTITPEVTACLGEVSMVGRERWEEIRRLSVVEHVPVAEIARRLELDRKTVRRWLRSDSWQPYTRPPRPDTLLARHRAYLQARAAQVGYSA